MLKKALQKSFVRYVIVGLTSLGVDYGSLLFFYHIVGLDLALAASTGFFIGLVVNFLLNKFWSFDTGKTTAKQSARQAVMVAILVVFNLLVTNFVVVYLNKWHVGPEISKIITTGIITMWNYVLYKKLIFKEPIPLA